jgi:hypothetical protein
MSNDRSPVEAWRDPIVAEVRQVREALFAESNYDIYEFCRRVSERQATSGHTVVKPSEATRKSQVGPARRRHSARKRNSS